MQENPTHYDTLEVPANAPSDRIKESYHLLASVWHPDRFPRGTKQHQLATRKLREINGAYEVLSDPERRAEYDRDLLAEQRVSGIYWTLRAQGRVGPPSHAPNWPALLTYPLGFVTGIVFLLISAYRHDRFVRFHAWQATFFGVIVYLGIVVGPLIGLERPAYWVLWMTAAAVYTVFLMRRAYHNRYYCIPLVGELAAWCAGVESFAHSKA